MVFVGVAVGLVMVLDSTSVVALLLAKDPGINKNMMKCRTILLLVISPTPLGRGSKRSTMLIVSSISN